MVSVRCMICGTVVDTESDIAICTGYVFSEKGEEDVPSEPCFCSQKCVDEFLDKYANPIFQNRKALLLFKERFPTEYRSILRKPKLFLELMEKAMSEAK